MNYLKEIKCNIENVNSLYETVNFKLEKKRKLFNNLKQWILSLKKKYWIIWKKINVFGNNLCETVNFKFEKSLVYSDWSLAGADVVMFLCT